MTMPIDLVLVRHGQSEGNIANKRSVKGDHSAFTPDFLKRHSASWRLSDLGIEQAKAAGEWIKKNIGEEFDRYYTSEYIRALETAGHLALPNARWYRELYLRERDWGDLDVLPNNERVERFAESLARRESSSLLWTPSNGQSLVDKARDIDRVLDTMHRECSKMRVIMVCHGESMWTFRLRLERMTMQRFEELDRSDNPSDHIHNCQIIHYTRRHPETGEIVPHLNWLRSICPWNLEKSRNTWEPIIRTKWTNEDLLAVAAKVPRLVNG